MSERRLLSREMESAAAHCGFDCPRGLVGSVIGYLMAWTHGWRGPWVLGALEIKPHDRVLGIGFGPGAEIQRTAKLAVLPGLCAYYCSPGHLRFLRFLLPMKIERETQQDHRQTDRRPDRSVEPKVYG